jgi:hypothetical protein
MQVLIYAVIEVDLKDQNLQTIPHGHCTHMLGLLVGTSTNRAALPPLTVRINVGLGPGSSATPAVFRNA